MTHIAPWLHFFALFHRLFQKLQVVKTCIGQNFTTEYILLSWPLKGSNMKESVCTSVLLSFRKITQIWWSGWLTGTKSSSLLAFCEISEILLTSLTLSHGALSRTETVVMTKVSCSVNSGTNYVSWVMSARQHSTTSSWPPQLLQPYSKPFDLPNFIGFSKGKRDLLLRRPFLF